MDSLTFPRFLVLSLFAVVVGACAGGSAPVTVPGEGESVMRGALRAIERRWSDAVPGTTALMACPGAAPSPSELRGDFNGDALPDVALAIDAGGASRLVVALTRLGNVSTLVEVGEGLLAAPLMLEVEPEGADYRLESLPIDLFFGTDTIVSRACDGTRTAWLWTGDGFQPRRLVN